MAARRRALQHRVHSQSCLQAGRVAQGVRQMYYRQDAAPMTWRAVILEVGKSRFSRISTSGQELNTVESTAALKFKHYSQHAPRAERRYPTVR